MKRDNVVLKVENSGANIDENELSKLFRPFYRGSGDIERSLNGVGLGLAVVEQYTRMHDGSVDVTSDHDNTTFTVTIPKRASNGGSLDV